MSEPTFEMKSMSDLFALFAVTTTLPMLLQKDNKSPEAFQIKMLSNHFYVNYLEASADEKKAVLEMVKSNQVTLEAALVEANQLIQEEINKLNAPL